MRTYLVCLALFTSVACGTKTEDNNATPTPDSGSPDMTVVDMGPQVMCPIEGYLFCGEKCLDVSFDLDHCGSCGNSCTRGTMTCMMGECLCLGDGVMCDGECYDLADSRIHCGECGISCSAGEICSGGDCIEISSDPRTLGVLASTNEGRAAQQDCGVNGIKPAVGPVQLNAELNAAAQSHAEDMAANMFLEHEGSDGRAPSDRARDAGYPGSLTAENIAEGYSSPAAVVAGWIDSDGHCQNLMNGRLEEMGVGYAEVPNTGYPYWVQLFGAQ